jgi:large subunit ribosomal protein L6
MSRIGKLPIEVPKSVTATIAGQLLKVEGPKGKLSREIRPEIKAVLDGSKLTFEVLTESGQANAFHGLERSLAANMIKGVSDGFVKELSLIGTGYRADQAGPTTLNLALGYSHAIDYEVPAGVKATVVKENRDVFIKLESSDKQLLGQVAAQIRSLRPPEPYKGKGVRYKDEVIKLKAGKAGKK